MTISVSGGTYVLKVAENHYRIVVEPNVVQILSVGTQGPPGAPGADGPPGADGAPGPNEVTTSTATDLTGVLTGDGSHVGVATNVAFTDQHNFFSQSQSIADGVAVVGSSGTFGYDITFDAGPFGLLTGGLKYNVNTSTTEIGGQASVILFKATNATVARIGSDGITIYPQATNSGATHHGSGITTPSKIIGDASQSGDLQLITGVGGTGGTNDVPLGGYKSGNIALITQRGGNGYTGHDGGAGGDIILQTGIGGIGSPAGACGNIILQPSTNTNFVEAGKIQLLGARAFMLNGGEIELTAGQSLNHTGGSVNITGGEGTNNGTSTDGIGGNVVITGGEGEKVGGNVVLACGAGGTTNGTVYIDGGDGSPLMTVDDTGTLVNGNLTVQNPTPGQYGIYYGTVTDVSDVHNIRFGIGQIQSGGTSIFTQSDGDLKLDPCFGGSPASFLIFGQTQCKPKFGVHTPLFVIGASGQSANLQEWHNVNGDTLASVDKDGRLTARAVVANNTLVGTVPLTVKGAASQTANLQEWQDSDANVKASVDKDGILHAGGVITSAVNTAYVTGAFDAYSIGYDHGITLGAALTINWSSTSNWWETNDVGIKRNGAGVVKITDGSTGLGSIIAASFTGDGSGLTSLPASAITGTVPIPHGGTGSGTANGALNNLLPSQTTASGKVLTSNGTDTSWATPATGTVTSVGLTVPSVLSVSGSPVTGSGTLAVSLASQSANTVFAGPSSGSATAPTFRSLGTADYGNAFVCPMSFMIGVGSPATTGTSKTTVVVPPFDGTIVKCFANAKTGPTGAALICDINKNGTSIWNTSQANRIQIAAGSTTGTQTSFDTLTFSAGDQFTIDVDQVGTTLAGQDITITLSCLMKNG